MKKTIWPLRTNKTKQTHKCGVTITNGGPTVTEPKDMCSSLVFQRTKRTNWGSNKIRLVKSISVIKWTGKNMSQNGLMQGIRGAKIQATGKVDINRTGKTTTVNTAFSRLGKIELPIGVTNGVLLIHGVWVLHYRVLHHSQVQNDQKIKKILNNIKKIKTYKKISKHIKT